MVPRPDLHRLGTLRRRPQRHRHPVGQHRGHRLARRRRQLPLDRSGARGLVRRAPHSPPARGHSPPAGTVALLVTIATGIAGYFAPHTPRPPAVQPPPPKTTTLIPVSSARPQ